ncbi:MAG: hypothetical protein U0R21_10385 [Nocardioidaceae bacterium]
MTTGPANAARDVVRDPRGDASHGDILSVRVSHGPYNVWIGSAFAGHAYDEHSFVIQTKRRDGSRGPTFVARWWFAEVGARKEVQVQTLRAFRSENYAAAVCRLETAQLVPNYLSMNVPRSCLADRGVLPAKVRVRGITAGEEGPRIGTRDRTRFTKWVRSNW